MGRRTTDEDYVAICFGCGHPHEPVTEFDILCDHCARREDKP